MTGGADMENPVMVIHVDECSPARGHLKDGDLLWSIDGVQLQGLRHEQVNPHYVDLHKTRIHTKTIVYAYTIVFIFF